MILFGEGRRHLDLEIDLIHHAGGRVGMIVLNDTNALGGQVTLLAEAQYINTRAGANGCQE